MGESEVGSILADFVTQQFLGVVIGVALGVLGTLSVDRIRSRRGRREACRHLIATAMPICRRFRDMKDNLEFVSNQDVAILKHGLRSLSDVFPEDDAAALRDARKELRGVRIGCLHTWEAASTAAAKSQEKLKALRGMVGRVDDGELSRRAVLLRSSLLDAWQHFREAFRETRNYAAPDVRESIDEVLRWS